MLYVQESLGAKEDLVHTGHFHWIYTFQAGFSIVLSLLASFVLLYGAVFMYKQTGQFPPDLDFVTGMRHLHPGFRIVAFVIFILGVFRFAHMMIIKATTEIAITDRRLIYKRGLVARQVGEISIDRIEGVNVLQSILGRMLNYGRVAVRGMGVGEVVLPPIEHPVDFRRAIEKARLGQHGR